MKKAVMEKWVAALRSGKYNQGTGQLKNDYNEFCPLGVLCDISGQGKFNKENEYQVKGTNVSYLCALPKAVINLSGIKHSLPGTGTVSINVLNDYHKASFKEIADFIEKNYEEL